MPPNFSNSFNFSNFSNFSNFFNSSNSLKNTIPTEVHKEGNNGYHNDTEDDVNPHEGAVLLDELTVSHNVIDISPSLTPPSRVENNSRE